MRKLLGGAAYVVAALLTLLATGTIIRIIRGETLADGELLAAVLWLVFASALCALGFIAFNPKEADGDGTEVIPPE